MTVDFCDAKAKCSPLVGERFHILHNEGAVVGLLVVVIDDHSQIAESMLPCTQAIFPNGARLGLAVAYQNEHPVRSLVQAGTGSKSNVDWQPMAQAAGRRFNTRNLAVFGMPTENAITLAKLPQLLFREKAFVRKDCVQRQASVSFTENAAITLLP